MDHAARGSLVRSDDADVFIIGGYNFITSKWLALVQILLPRLFNIGIGAVLEF